MGAREAQNKSLALTLASCPSNSGAFEGLAMKHEGWPTFSYTDLLRPPDGWQAEHAILTTYSADLVVIVTALLALTGCDLDYRRTGSRVELVKAIEALRGRVCVVAQAGRVANPNK